MKYGYWSVVDRKNNSDGKDVKWLCRCVCGELRLVYVTSLKSGRSKSCGCKTECIRRENRYGNYVGGTFGQWTVLDVGYGKTNRGKTVWKVRCSCGYEGTRTAATILEGSTRCRSCAQKESAKNRGQSGTPGLNVVYSRYVDRATKKGLEFEIDKQQFYVLSQQNCHYCGSPPATKTNAWRRNLSENYLYNGLDRVDSEQGYRLDNVVPSCFICNRAKGTLSKEEFLSWLMRAQKYQEKCKRPLDK